MNKLKTLRHAILFAAFMIFMMPVKSQVITRYLTDFGAVGDSVTDNTDAFIKAGIFFSNFLTGDTTGILIIPSYHPANSNNPAVYKVGRQLVMNDSFLVTCTYNGIEKRRKFRHTNPLQGVKSGLADTLDNYGMLLLNNVHGLVVKGSDSLHPPVIRYKDSLYFGSFVKSPYKFKAYKTCYSTTCVPYTAAINYQDSTSQPAYGCPGFPTCISCVCKAGTPDTFTNVPSVVYSQTNAGIAPLNWYGENTDHKTKAWISHFITVQNSSRVTIQDLIIDGNNAHFVWGGTFSDAGIQLPHSGIACYNSDTVTVKRVEASRFGFDGMLIDNGSNYILMDSCKFNENTREGLSWTGGKYLTATHCQFNESGKNNIATLSNPGAGLDIEPDGGDSCLHG